MILFEKLFILILISVILNVPFGSYRLLTRKFSLAWILSIHLPIPIIVILRTTVFDLPLWVIPITLGSAIAGQIIGSRFPHCGEGLSGYIGRPTVSGS